MKSYLSNAPSAPLGLREPLPPRKHHQKVAHFFNKLTNNQRNELVALCYYGTADPSMFCSRLIRWIGQQP